MVAAPPKNKKTKKKQNSKVKKWSKLKFKSGPIMLRNISGPLFNFKMCVLLLLFWLVFQTSSSFCRENEIFEKKMDHFLTLKRAKIGPLFTITAYIYIYIFFFVDLFRCVYVCCYARIRACHLQISVFRRFQDDRREAHPINSCSAQ